MMNDRAPILVGLGEVTRRAHDPELTSVPAFIAHTLRCAATDAYEQDAPQWNAAIDGPSAALLAATDLIAVAPSASWPDQAPGVAIGRELGLDDVATMRSSMVGGNGSQLLINAVAARIQRGDVEVALVCGGEALHSQRTPFEDFGAMAMQQPDGSTEVLEGDRAGNSEAEVAVGLMLPVLGYALMEQAIGRAAGRTVSAQRAHAAELWSSLSSVAADHPNAWIRERASADEIATASAANRQVSWPYTKLMVANLRIDEAAAVVMCSVGAARKLGIAPSRWVYVHAGAQAHDEWFLSERADLDRSPAIAACGDALYARAGITAADLGPVDLYSCFPSAVAIAARELGLPTDDPARPLSCTGGLTFFGGPGNNFGTHGVIGVARELRQQPPGALGLSSSLGWYATKHAIGLYGNAAPTEPYDTLHPTPTPAHRDVASAADAAAASGGADAGVGAGAGADGGAGAASGASAGDGGAGESAGAVEAGAVVEVATAFFGRDGVPEFGIVFALLPDGRRALGRTTDPELLQRICSDAFIGTAVRLDADRTVHLR
jgi:acetyl-CoA C-acetyltransferase